MNWYKGPTLIEALDSLKPNIKVTRKDLRLPVQDVYEIDNEKIIVGRLISGVITKGQKIIFLPNFKEAEIKAIKTFEGGKKRAQEGENIGIVLDKLLPIKRGEIITQKETPPEPANSFKGNIFWMSDEPLQLNKTITLRCATQEAKCIAERIEKRINSSTLEVIEENSDELRLNEIGLVIFKIEAPILIEKFDFIEGMGRFVIEDEYNLQGAGTVTCLDL